MSVKKLSKVSKIKESLIKQRNSFWASSVIIKAFKKDWLIDFDFFEFRTK
jgi:hypothetical protein